MTEINCDLCSRTFGSPYGLRSHRKFHDEEYKDRHKKFTVESIQKAASLAHELKRKRPKFTKCTFCLSEMIVKGKNQFCSSACAAFHNNVSNDKFRKSNITIIQCIHCERYVALRGKNNPRKTCSDECYHEISCSMKKKGFVTETVHDSTGKKCYLQSSWEIEIYEFLSTNNIPWERPKAIKWNDMGKTRKCFLDFYIPSLDIYLDPKNQWLMKNRDKNKIYELSRVVTVYFGSVDFLKSKVLEHL